MIGFELPNIHMNLNKLEIDIFFRPTKQLYIDGSDWDARWEIIAIGALQNVKQMNKETHFISGLSAKIYIVTIIWMLYENELCIINARAQYSVHCQKTNTHLYI